MPKHSIYALLASLINYPFYLLSTIQKLKGVIGGLVMKNLPGNLSRPPQVGTSSGTVAITLPRAGNPTVPEYRGIDALTPEIIKQENSAWGPL